MWGVEADLAAESLDAPALLTLCQSQQPIVKHLSQTQRLPITSFTYRSHCCVLLETSGSNHVGDTHVSMDIHCLSQDVVHRHPFVATEDFR